jgi:kumamolisin
LHAQNISAGWVRFPNSVRAVPLAGAPTTPGLPQPRLLRPSLTDTEMGADLVFEVAFRMRNYDELRGRVARGETISFRELATRYEPLAGDYNAVADWLQQQGFSIVRRDPRHLAVFARGPVRRVAQAFRVNFGRVTFAGGEFSSALTAPSLPAELAAPVLGVNGLQPHLRAQALARRAKVKPAAKAKPASTSSFAPPYTPANLLHAYNGTTVAATGANQTIAIVIDTFPSTSDLTSFWSLCGVNQSLANISLIQAVNGTLSSPSLECTLDVEWSSSIAPAAQVRVYATVNLDFVNTDQAYQEIVTDLTNNPGSIQQMSMSYGIGETYESFDQIVTDNQYFAEIASAGVTIFVSSGDGGSNPNTNGDYSPSAPLQVESPASDYFVTAVGGTTLQLNANTGNITSETAWSDGGGGVSEYFVRPPWQTGSGVVSGSTRLVPDVASSADPDDPALLIYEGEQVEVGGTSWGAPTWAGICARINQANVEAGRPTVGLLGPDIYPLLGTSAFHDILSGSNGAYSAGPGYDLCTGLGSPNIANLVGYLVSIPAFIVQPTDQETNPGQGAVFSLSANGTGTLSYQWQISTNAGDTWSNLTDNATYSGSVTPSLAVANATSEMNGYAYQCVATNAYGSGTSDGAVLIVNAWLNVSTLAGKATISGNTDGQGPAALFHQPEGIAIAPSGIIYAADSLNDTIRKITPTGNVTTFAGTAGSAGSTDGTGSSARFNDPTGVAVDSGGNIYVADTLNETIRKIAPNGNVTTFAGKTGTAGSTNGTTGVARFNHPVGLALDASGNLYIADSSNNAIRKIAPSNTGTFTVSTFAGRAGSSGNTDGTGSNARFDDPLGVTVDASDNLYVADSKNDTIREITSAAVVTTIAGSAGVAGDSDDFGTNALFDDPTAVAADGLGNVYVVDALNYTARVIGPSSLVFTTAGQPGVSGSVDGIGQSAGFTAPYAIAANSSGNVYLTDQDAIRLGSLIVTPEFVSSPGNQTVGSGGTAVFTTSATGNPAPAFQWYENNLPLTNGANVTGANTSSLTLSNLTYASNGAALFVQAQNAVAAVNSTTVILTVTPIAPTITLQPVSQTYTTGQNAQFSAAATGDPAPDYQWLRFPAGGSGWANLTDGGAYNGTATATLTVENVTLAMAGDQFLCVATNAGGNVSTNPATLTVLAPTAFTAWQQTYFTPAQMSNPAISGPNATPANDGLTNLLKYAFGLNPFVDGHPYLPQPTSANNQIVLSFTALQSDITYTVEASTDLVNWSTAGVTVQTSGNQVTASYPLGTQPVFLRIVVTQN